MRFLVDAQLPPALARWLADQGCPSEHVFQVGLATADDPGIWTYAVSAQAVLITKDEDFLAIRSAAGTGPAVVWLRIGNATNRVLIGWFAARFPAVLAALGAGELIVEVR